MAVGVPGLPAQHAESSGGAGPAGAAAAALQRKRHTEGNTREKEHCWRETTTYRDAHTNPEEMRLYQAQSNTATIFFFFLLLLSEELLQTIL